MMDQVLKQSVEEIKKKLEAFLKEDKANAAASEKYNLHDR